ncbi:MAG: DUF5668 domain-containing protein, partial [Chloroflexota bacterium]|nr:DUF5668 domain-containing protein [Chloroflexota bacterium]
MRNRSLFWGIVFIVVGGLFLLNNFAIISINIWKVIWPILLILLGAWVLWQTQYRKPSIETETASISSRGAN